VTLLIGTDTLFGLDSTITYFPWTLAIGNVLFKSKIIFLEKSAIVSITYLLNNSIKTQKAYSLNLFQHLLAV
jgi:hypothetical protein